MMEGRLNEARQIAIDDAWIDTLSLCLYVNKFDGMMYMTRLQEPGSGITASA
jgi:hypothetical protein